MCERDCRDVLLYIPSHHDSVQFRQGEKTKIFSLTGLDNMSSESYRNKRCRSTSSKKRTGSRTGGWGDPFFTDSCGGSVKEKEPVK